MSVMQHFQLDRSHSPDEEPLYQFGSGSGPAPGSYERIKSPGGIWSADDSGRSGLLGRFDEWWYSMSPSKRQAAKKTALGALAVGVLVLAIILVALISSSSSKTRDEEQGFVATAPPPTQDSESDATATPPAVAAASPPPTSSSPPADLTPPAQSPTAAPDGATPPPTLSPPTTVVSPSPPVLAPPANQDANDFCSWEDLYLPKAVIPVRYDLNLSVFLDHMADASQAANNRVEGSVAIRVRLPFATRCVLMHMDENVIKVSSFLWRSPEGKEILGDFKSMMEEAVQVSFQFKDLLPASPNNTDPMTKNGTSDEASLGQIIINFTYNLTAGLDGFYTSTYAEADGTQHVMASTQFESTAARKALPLFDEPHFKARFALTLAAAPDYTVLSNMPLESLGDVREDGLQERKFMVSPPMSSYLMAWVVGVLGNVTNPTCATQTSPDADAITVPITVYSTLSKVSLLNDSLSAACAAVQRFVATLGVPYPLPKLDLVGIPEFAAGAMENWGLITYKETYLLVDPAPTDVHQLIDVGTVVAHEIAHQWFGNLVTCADWTELWLNEGFATYFENVGADAWRPGYGFLQAFFFTVATMPALVEDAVNSTHPLSSLKQVANLTEIDNYFDGISYEKGGAVLRMLRMYMSVAVSGGADFTTVGAVANKTVPTTGQVTPLAFSSANLTYLPLRRRLAEAPITAKPRNRKLLDHEPGHVDDLNFTTYSRPTWKDEPLFTALKTYLERKQYGVVTAKELWAILEEVTGLPISTWMASWTYDSNYPVVHVDSVITSQVPDPANPGANITRATVTVHQAPMLATRKCGVSVAVAEGDNSAQYRVGKWWLPITAALQADDASNQVQVVTMDECTASFSLDMGGSPDAPILLNIGRYGFYRVNYTEEGWRQASDAAENTDVVSAMDMSGLLSDSYRLNEKQQLDLEPFMNLIQSLGVRGQAEYGPWAVALAKLRRMRLLINNAAAEITKTYLSCIDQLNTFMVVNVTQPFIDEQGLDFDVSEKADSVELRLIRPMILTASGMADDHTTLKSAQKLMRKVETAIANDENVAEVVHPDVREAVYCLNMRAEKNKKKGEKAFHDTKKLYIEAAGDPVERDRLLYALTCGQHKSVHKDLLQFLITPDVRIQDVGPTLLALGSQGGSAFEAVWDFMFNPEEFDQLVNRWPSRPSATYSLGLPIKQLATLFPDNSRDADMATFVEMYKDMLDPTFLQWYKEHTASNVAWFKTTAQELCEYLDEAR